MVDLAHWAAELTICSDRVQNDQEPLTNGQNIGESTPSIDGKDADSPNLDLQQPVFRVTSVNAAVGLTVVMNSQILGLIVKKFAKKQDFLLTNLPNPTQSVVKAVEVESLHESPGT